MIKRYSKQTINERLFTCLEVISENYEIELTWVEKLSLKQYLIYCRNLFTERYLKESIEGAAIHLFMLDTFGFDSVVMQQGVTPDYDPKKLEERELYFEDWHKRKKQLQTHIRNNIHLRRAEREYL